MVLIRLTITFCTDQKRKEKKVNSISSKSSKRTEEEIIAALVFDCCCYTDDEMKLKQQNAHAHNTTQHKLTLILQFLYPTQTQTQERRTIWPKPEKINVLCIRLYVQEKNLITPNQTKPNKPQEKD